MTGMLLTCPGNEALGASLQRALSLQPIAFELRRFPDHEAYLRIESEVVGQPVAVLCSLREPDSHVLPLVYMSDTLRELGAARVGLIAPYLAYMRQDRRFRPGEAVTSTSFARILSTHFDWLVTVDPHLHRRRALEEIYTIPTRIVRAAPLISDWIRREVDSPVVVGPDAESAQWAKAVAHVVDCPHVVLEKTRRGDRDVEVSAIPDIDQWRAHTPVLIDDIISSGHTMVEALKQWRGVGKSAPICMAVHGVFADGAYEALRAAGGRSVTTNSIAHPTNEIDLTPALVEPVRSCLQ